MAPEKIEPQPHVLQALAHVSSEGASSLPTIAHAERYSAESIVVLDGVQAVRKRPGMYIGDVQDGSGLHHCLMEVVSNVVDLHLAQLCTSLSVSIQGDWVTVTDDGPGIPNSLRSHDLGWLFHRIFGTLHAGATLFGHYPHVHVTPSMHGVGVAAVNALSRQFEVTSNHQGQRWTATYERGILTQPVRCLGTTSQSGTTIAFQPDSQIFSRIEWCQKRIKDQLTLLARLNPLLQVYFQGERLAPREGLWGWVQHLAERYERPLQGVVVTRHTVKDIVVELAMGWVDRPETTLLGFVNQNRSNEGTHLSGLLRGLKKRVSSLNLAPDNKVTSSQLAQGLIAVVSVHLLDPEFASPCRDHLKNPEAGIAVKRAVTGLPVAMAHALDRYLQARFSQPASR